MIPTKTTEKTTKTVYKAIFVDIAAFNTMEWFKPRKKLNYG